MAQSSLTKEITKVALRGLATILPIALTIAILWWAGTAAEKLLGSLLKWILGQFGTEVYIPGMGLALGFAIVLTVGLLTRAWLVQKLLKLGDWAMESVPVAKTIYSAIKDVMTFLAQGDDSQNISKVVMVKLEGAGEIIGFQTRESGTTLTQREEDAEKVAVYLPMSYQIGGFLVFVPKDRVSPLDMTVEQALRLSVTAGMAVNQDDEGLVPAALQSGGAKESEAKGGDADDADR